jgi:hypothetical protein
MGIVNGVKSFCSAAFCFSMFSFCLISLIVSLSESILAFNCVSFSDCALNTKSFVLTERFSFLSLCSCFVFLRSSSRSVEEESEVFCRFGDGRRVRNLIFIGFFIESAFGGDSYG